MKQSLKISIAFILITGALTQKKLCQHLGFGQTKHHSSYAISNQDVPENDKSTDNNIGSYSISDEVYEWDNSQFDWVKIDNIEPMPPATFVSSSVNNYDSESITIEWKQLMNIKYKLKYYKELETEMYAPIFNKALKAIDGKEVTIKGYVIPIEIESEMMALSANSYSSCFFCGKASPASVMSLHLKKYKFYKTDAFKKFRGTLHLNYDDPNEFYYILKDAVPIK